MYRLAIAACALLFLTMGCSKNPFSDPVSQLKDHISHVSNGRDKDFNNEWRNVKYDVEKTNSLVSPYTATISAEVYQFNYKTDTISDARYDFDLTLAYQDGDWVLKDDRLQKNVPNGDKWEPFEGKETLHSGETYWDMIELQLKLKKSGG